MVYIYPTDYDTFTVMQHINDSRDVVDEGRVKLTTNNNKSKWQLISIPIRNKKVKEYFLDWLDNKIKTYNSSKGITDVIERVSAFPGNLDEILTYIPGTTPETNSGNFDLVISDEINVNEILSFWAKIKDYKSITGGEEIIFEWAAEDE